jgi:hypothetical protein
MDGVFAGMMGKEKGFRKWKRGEKGIVTHCGKQLRLDTYLAKLINGKIRCMNEMTNVVHFI